MSRLLCFPVCCNVGLEELSIKPKEMWNPVPITADVIGFNNRLWNAAVVSFVNCAKPSQSVVICIQQHQPSMWE